MELSKEVHGLLDRIKRLSNANLKPVMEDSYKFDMKASYSTLDDDFSSDDLIPVEDIDFSDKETWLYVSEESSTNTESSDIVPRDMTRLIHGDFCENQNSAIKNVDTRTFTRPKKRFFNHLKSTQNRDEQIGDQINQTKLKINGICEELNHIEQIRIPENPFKDANLEKDGSISTGPLHFKLSDPVLNHSFDKILLMASDKYDSFINMDPPSLMNSLCSSSLMDTSLALNSEKSDPYISTEESLTEFLSPFKTSQTNFDSTLKCISEAPLNKGNVTSTPIKPSLSLKKDPSALNTTFTPKKQNFEPVYMDPEPEEQILEAKNISLIDENKFFDAEMQNFDSPILEQKFSKGQNFVPCPKNVGNFKSEVSEVEQNFVTENFVPSPKNAKNFNSEVPEVEQNFVPEKFVPAPKNVTNFSEAFNKKQNCVPEMPNDFYKVPEGPTAFKFQRNNKLDATFDSKVVQVPEKRILDETFDSNKKNSELDSKKFESKIGKQFDDLKSRLVPPNLRVPEVRKGQNLDSTYDTVGSDEAFMVNEHKKLLDATFESKTTKFETKVSKLRRNSLLKNDENKSLNSTFTNLSRPKEKSLNDSDSSLNSTFTKNKLNTFMRKSRNITNLPETFKMSCPDINKTFQSPSYLDKSKLNRTYQKLSDSQPNLSKTDILKHQNLELRNSNAYEGYKMSTLGSTDSLDEKSSSISSSSKESTSKILNIGDLDNLARLQEQSLHQVMSTPKSKTAMTRFWDSEVMSPIPRTDIEYLSEDSDFTDFSDQCVTARSRSSRPSTAGSSDTFRRPVPTVPKHEVKRPAPVGYSRTQQNKQTTRNVPTMVVKPMEMTRNIKLSETKPVVQVSSQQNTAVPRVRPSGLPRPTSALQTGIPRPVSRIPGPRFNSRSQLTRPASFKHPSNQHNTWTDGYY